MDAGQDPALELAIERVEDAGAEEQHGKKADAERGEEPEPPRRAVDPGQGRGLAGRRGHWAGVILAATYLPAVIREWRNMDDSLRGIVTLHRGRGIRPDGQGCRRRTTIRRFGSSPMDCVTTSGFSRRAMWTQRRSSAGMGSSWSILPVSRTPPAARVARSRS